VAEFGYRFTGSSDLYESTGRTPSASINFITAHDGFTLADLVSYEQKHNEANGEDNRDGSDDNGSWNGGVEGPTDDPDIQALRRRQQRNLLATLMLSQGVPMVLGGDEIGRTQQGNNNAYCQDNEIGWLDWSLVEANADLLRYWRLLLAFRRANPTLWQPDFYTATPIRPGVPDVAWHGTRLHAPGWDDPQARALACTLGGPAGAADLHVMMNMHWEPLDFDVPALDGRMWTQAIDTALPAGQDIRDPGSEPAVPGGTYRVQARSIAVLASRPSG